jgi:DNA-binding HxlR family transcriptional regulator
VASRLVMGQELRAAIAELTQNAPNTTRSELFQRYFRNADWGSFNRQLSILGLEGLVANRPHPTVAGERLVGLTDLGREIRIPYAAMERGRKRRQESRLEKVRSEHPDQHSQSADGNREH